MSVKRKKYSKQFKLDAIQMYENGEKSMALVERELGITDGLLAKWRDDLQRVKDPASVFPGNGHLPEQEARIRQLELENAQLRQEKEILKKCWGSTQRTRNEVPVHWESPAELPSGAAMQCAGSLAERLLCLARAAGEARAGRLSAG